MSAPKPEEVFWMVCRKPGSPNSVTQPKVRYSHHDTAWDAAAKLARETGHDFALLQVVEIVTPAARLTQGRLF